MFRYYQNLKHLLIWPLAYKIFIMTNEKASLYISKKCKKKGVIVEMINEICTCIYCLKEFKAT